MKSMKVFKFLMMTVAAVVLASFVSCNDAADDSIDGGNSEAANAYLSFNIAFADGTNLRGAETGPEEPASPLENEINDLHLYFFDTNDEYVTTVQVNKALLSPSNGGANSGSVAVRFPTVPGDYKVIAVANEALTAPAPGTDLIVFLKYVSGQNYITNVTAGTGLPMASRTNNTETFGAYTGSQPYTEFTITAAHTKTNPVQIKMTLERTVAKLMVAANEDGANANKYELNAGYNDECVVTIEGYRVININEIKYVFRNTMIGGYDYESDTYRGYGNIYDGVQSKSGDPAVPAYQFGNVYAYVWDPTSTSKNSTVGPIEYPSGTSYTYKNPVDDIIKTASVTPGLFTGMPNSATYALIGYSAENTARHNAQRNGYSMGMIFRGKVTPTKVFANDGSITGSYSTIYYSTKSGNFYDSPEAVVYDAANTKFSNVSEITSITDLELLEAAGLQKFNDGYCYYTYWIKHLPDDDVKNQIMEFGIVRNNVYKMKVLSISKLGTSDVFIDPTDPNELNEMFFKVDLDIRPWIVRSNDINL